MDNIRPYQSL